MLKFKNSLPEIHDETFIAENAFLIGDVTVNKGASVWFNCVLRGDLNKIIIGEYSNIQDGVIIHTDEGMPTIVGNYVTVGHGAILHGCKISDKALIGMGAIIMDGAEISEGAIVGAGSVVTAGTKVPPNTLVVGTPAKPKKVFNEEEQEGRVKHALYYMKLWQEFEQNQ
ncbi:MAG: gamma carbonic anhydrase family protein [Clostridia bacterium]|nr:gamma carbonic anhydrase family protein [Clostridia bacterium]